MRDEAKKELGEKFDLKAFHNEILNGGAMPLELLQERVEGLDQKSSRAKPTNENLRVNVE